MSFTSGLHGPRVLLTIPKTFDDFEVISVIVYVLPRIIWNLILLRGNISDVCVAAERIRIDLITGTNKYNV